MKRAKITISPDLVADPPMRIVKVGARSRAVLGVYKGESLGFSWNFHAKKYEVTIDFLDPDDERNDRYRLVGDQLYMERLIVKLQETIKQIPDH